jgi:signal transduction histidine kinase
VEPRDHRSLLRSGLRTLALAAALALAVSIEFLFQPFIWRNYTADEVLVGWLFVLGDRAWVAFLIAAAAWLGLTMGRRLPLLIRSALFIVLVIFAALAAEMMLRHMGTSGAASTTLDLGMRVLRWSTLALAVGGLLLAWRGTLRAEEAVRTARQQRVAANTQLADLRLQALQSQIEPHFLFNTLATARRLGATDPARCGQLLANLHDFVRLSRAAAPGALPWRLADELQLVRAYLGVIELRMGARLRLRYEIGDDAAACRTPALSLATLVENAVKHGITPATDGGEITISARCEPAGDSGSTASLVLCVADTGLGFDGADTGGGSGIGLANTRARLQNLYGASAALHLAANEPRGARATIRIPASWT